MCATLSRASSSFLFHEWCGRWGRRRVGTWTGLWIMIKMHLCCLRLHTSRVPRLSYQLRWINQRQVGWLLGWPREVDVVGNQVERMTMRRQDGRWGWQRASRRWSCLYYWQTEDDASPRSLSLSRTTSRSTIIIFIHLLLLQVAAAAALQYYCGRSRKNKFVFGDLQKVTHRIPCGHETGNWLKRHFSITYYYHYHHGLAWLDLPWLSESFSPGEPGN